MSPKERREYDAHIDTIMVQNDVLDTAREEGLAEGLEEGKKIGRAEGLEEGRAEGRAEGKAEGRAEGLAEGLEEGKAEERRNTALKMISMGMSNEIIISLTGLSEKEINSLRDF